MGSAMGVDVSEFNGTLDWAKLKKAGVEFAIIRSGYGTSYEDPQFKNNVAGCEKNGIPYGIYHFTYALNTAGVLNEAAFVKSLIAKRCSKKPFCVAFDFEGDTVSYAKKHGVTLGKSAFNNHMATWNKYFTALGYSTPVYVNLNYYTNWYDKSILGSYPLWPAYYQPTCFVKNYAVWQQTSSGTFSGFSGRFDIDYSTDEYINGGSTPTPDPDPEPTEKESIGEHYKKTTASANATVYKDCLKKTAVGSVDKGETIWIYSVYNGMYFIMYHLDSGGYAGGFIDADNRYKS